MEKKLLNKGKGFGPVSLPGNVLSFLKDRTEMKKAANKANRWLHDICNRNFTDGTAIGKHYDTLILDIQHHSSDVYISNDGEIEVSGEPANDKKTFHKLLLEKYDIV